MDAKEIREWIQKRAHACPCCGGSILVQVDTDAEGQRLWANFSKHREARICLVSAEEAEAEINAKGFGPIGQSIGGRNQ